MSGDLHDLTEPYDPALESLVRALTAAGTADEMARRPAALEMFRDSRRPPRRLRSAFSRSTAAAAAAIVLAGGIAAAYAAALPAPVQHIAYRMLGSIGVPDTHPPAPPSSPPRAIASIPPTRSAPVATGCGCRPGRPGADAAPGLILVAARAQIPAGGDEVLSGRLAPGGRPEAGVRVRLFEHTADRPGWRAAGSAVTGRSGDVTLTVPHLTSNAAFRLAARGRVVSRAVFVTVIAPVSVSVAEDHATGLAMLTARAPFAQPGDVVVLEERAGGAWYRIGERVLSQEHLATFSVLIPRSGEVTYRVVLPRTAVHGRSASGRVRMGAASSGTGRRGPP